MVKESSTMSNTTLRFAVAVSAIILFSIPYDHGNAQVSYQWALKYWVYFTDKGHSVPPTGSIVNNSPLYDVAHAIVSQRALARRAKVLPAEALLDAADLPLCEEYLDGVRSHGGILVEQIRWMNAASFILPSDQIMESRMMIPFYLLLED